ncbi:MAG: DUF72 domain-containing protein [Chloroflexota bacterium]|nr:DUF72 domain-containing protein [Chloroflexota bacterium]
MAGQVLVGTCNWADHQGYYPPGLKSTERISYYAGHFPVVEVDSTYYSLQPRRNFEAWCARTPEGFLFNVKAYRELTQHNRNPSGAVETPSVESFQKFSYSLDPMRECGKLRAVHFQFPPWFRRSQQNLEYIQTCRELMPDDLLAVEFRHRSWMEGEHADETLAFLRERHLAYVMVDEPQVGSGSVPPTVAVTNPDLAIVRFHGRNAETWYKKGLKSSTERFKYLYTQQELAEWIPAVERVQQEAREVHLLLNNNYGNYAVRNAVDLLELLGQPAPQLELPEMALDQPQLL